MSACPHRFHEYGVYVVCSVCGVCGELNQRGVLQQIATVPEWRMQQVRRALQLGLRADASWPAIEAAKNGTQAPEPATPQVDDGVQLDLFGDAA